MEGGNMPEEVERVVILVDESGNLLFTEDNPGEVTRGEDD